MRNFKELTIWQKSHLLTLEIYKFTNTFPAYELYGLSFQMRRSAASIPTNIAEGCGKNSNPEMKRYLTIASGSCSELEYQIILAHDLKYFPSNIFIELQETVVEIRKMIHSFIKKVL